MRQKKDSTSSFTVPKQGSFSYNYSHSIITSKPANISNQAKKSNDLFRPREMVPWGVAKGENTFESSYSCNFGGHNNGSNSSRSPNRVIPEAFYPSENLSSTFIPTNTPKFTRGKRYIDAPQVSSRERSVESPPRSGRKQFNEIKHKKDYTKDESPLSYREFDGPLARSRTISPENQRVSTVIKNVFLHHSQVKENFYMDTEKSTEFDRTLSLFSKTIDETRTAGSSEFRSFLKPPKKGKLPATPQPDTDMKNFMSNTFRDEDPRPRLKEEIQSRISPPIKALKLRNEGGQYDRHILEFERRSVSPNYMRGASPLSRSLFQEASSHKRSQTPDINATMTQSTKSKSGIEETMNSSKQRDTSPRTVPKIPLAKAKEVRSGQSTARNTGSKTNHTRTSSPMAWRNTERTDRTELYGRIDSARRNQKTYEPVLEKKSMSSRQSIGREIKARVNTNLGGKRTGVTSVSKKHFK